MRKRDLGLVGKAYLVTGAAGFLGTHIMNALEDEVAVGYGIDQFDDGGEIVGVDITDEVAVVNYSDEIAEELDENKKLGFGVTELHGIINNAAISFKGKDISYDDFVKTMEVNVAGMYNIINAFQDLLSDDASIVNISSIYGSLSPDFSIYDGDPSLFNNVSYGCSKAAVNQMTRYYAKLYAPNIRVNSIMLGGVQNEQQQSKSFIEKYCKNVPMSRMARPDDLVNGVIFLLSSMSSYITGASIPITGGIEIW